MTIATQADALAAITAEREHQDTAHPDSPVRRTLEDGIAIMRRYATQALQATDPNKALAEVRKTAALCVLIMETYGVVTRREEDSAVEQTTDAASSQPSAQPVPDAAVDEDAAEQAAETAGEITDTSAAA